MQMNIPATPAHSHGLGLTVALRLHTETRADTVTAPPKTIGITTWGNALPPLNVQPSPSFPRKRFVPLSGQEWAQALAISPTGAIVGAWGHSGADVVLANPLSFDQVDASRAFHWDGSTLRVFPIVKGVFWAQSVNDGAVVGTAKKVARAVQAELDPAGMNLMQCNGPGAAQSVMHFHVHVIPRGMDDGLTMNWEIVPGDMAAIGALAERLAARL